MNRSILLWPTLLLFSAMATWIVYALLPSMALRPLIVLWFLLVCPGMALVRFLRLREPIAEWTLAIAMSLVLDALVASVQLYAGRWSPPLSLNILIGLCVAGALVQLFFPRLATVPDSTT